MPILPYLHLIQLVIWLLRKWSEALPAMQPPNRGLVELCRCAAVTWDLPRADDTHCCHQKTREFLTTLGKELCLCDFSLKGQAQPALGSAHVHVYC